MNYQVQQLSIEQAEQIVRQHFRRPLMPAHRQIILSDGVVMTGSFGLVARDVETGKVAWEHEQANLVTDLGRLSFFTTAWGTLSLGFAPSREAPSIGRCTLSTDGSQCVVSTGQSTGTVTALTNTRSFGPITYSAPASNRTLGTLIVAHTASAPDANIGWPGVLAYTVLSPSKVQTIAQTIELNYKISISVIV